MKKVGILTLTASDNVGSLLQAYALQEVVKKESDYEVELINLENIKSKKLYSIFKPGLIKSPSKLLTTIKNYKVFKSQKDDYNDFRKKYLNLTKEKFADSNELKSIKNNYDKIICGSDQVWNVDMYDFDDAYFLRWADRIPKIAYAASLGGQDSIEPNEKLKSFKDIIESFESISIREKQGKDTLTKFVAKDITVCADPTLIIPRERWYEITEERLIKQEYIFYYSFNYGSDDLNNVVKKASEYYGLPVYVINASKWINKHPKHYNFNLYKKGGPEIFLNLMRYSKYAFVESLHGTIFAYIFRRNFWFLNSRKNDELDHRSEFILNSMNLRNRTVRPNNIDKVSLDLEINYERLNSKMNSWIDSSNEFLRDALKK